MDGGDLLNPPGFTNLRALHQQQADQIAQQKAQATRQAAETIELLTSVLRAPGYVVWKEALVASANGEHQQALNADSAHSMAIHLGAESAYRAAAHAVEDIIAQCQNSIEALKRG